MPPTWGATPDSSCPRDVASRGGEHARLVGSLSGRPAADRAFAHFRLGPVVGLILHVQLDELPRHLVAQGPGDVFQLGEFGAPRHAVGIKLLAQLPSHLAQPRLEFLPNLGRTITHVRSPAQVKDQLDQTPQTSIPKINPHPLAVQTMSCARFFIKPACDIDKSIGLSLN